MKTTLTYQQAMEVMLPIFQTFFNEARRYETWCGEQVKAGVAPEDLKTHYDGNAFIDFLVMTLFGVCGKTVTPEQIHQIFSEKWFNEFFDDLTLNSDPYHPITVRNAKEYLTDIYIWVREEDAEPPIMSGEYDIDGNRIGDYTDLPF